MARHLAAHPPVPQIALQDGNPRRAPRQRPPPELLDHTAPLSINRLVALHPRERLLVHPLCWTDRQLALLECRIHSRGEGSRGASAHENAEDGCPVPDDLARLLARRLNRRLSWGELTDTILKLLRPLGGDILLNHSQTAHLYFDRRSRAGIEYCCISVSIPGPALETVTFACFDIDATVLLRKRLFRPENRLGYMDLPGVYRLHTLSKRHTPADRQKDPYLVALIIALAQQERRRAAQPLPPSSSFTVGLFLSSFFLHVSSSSTTLGRASTNFGVIYQVRILFTGKGRPAPFNLFVAHVRACFLDKLDFPGQEPPVNSGLDIYRWHISAEPFPTLSQRLSQALRFDCCGETHEAESTSGIREGRGQKRKWDIDSDSQDRCSRRALVERERGR